MHYPISNCSYSNISALLFVNDVIYIRTVGIHPFIDVCTYPKEIHFEVIYKAVYTGSLFLAFDEVLVS
jgi:hypothetical protein